MLTACLLIGSMSLGAALPASPDPPYDGTTARIRPVSKSAEKLLDAGVRRSATFRDLVRALESTRTVVYIGLEQLGTHVDGETRLLGVSGPYRFVEVAVRPDLRRDWAIAVLAHELKHALEIAEAPDIRGQKSVRDLYRRIGRPGLNPERFDTDEARATGEQVGFELARPVQIPTSQHPYIPASPIPHPDPESLIPSP